MLWVGLSILVTACGSKDNSGNYRSTTPYTNGLLSECSRTASNNIGFSAALASYYQYGQVIEDYVQMNIPSIPAALTTSSVYLQIFRWKEPSAGARQTNSIPVRFFYVSKTTGMSLNSTPIDKISKGDIEQLIADKKLGNLGIGFSNFFQNHYIVMTGMEYQWQAVTFALYDSNNGTLNIGSADALLPPFLADPNKYANSKNGTSLPALHPLAYQSASGASEAEFKRLSDDICASFLGTIRAPASIDSDETRMGLFRRIWFTIQNFFINLFS